MWSLRVRFGTAMDGLSSECFLLLGTLSSGVHHRAAHHTLSGL